MASEYIGESNYNFPLPDLFTRGWVFQERILAPRILYFGHDEMHWECQRLEASEVAPRGQKYEMGWPMVHMNKLRAWETIRQASNKTRIDMWRDLAATYSFQLEFTHVTDRLVAISGLAADCGHNWDKTTYLAGLWSHQLRHGLLWQVDTSMDQDFFLPGRSVEYIAPSWSWVSVFSHVKLAENYGLSDGLAEVVEANVELLEASNPYGAVIGGFVRVKGPLIACRVMSKRPIAACWPCEVYLCSLAVNSKGAVDEEIELDYTEEQHPFDGRPRLTVTWDERPLREDFLYLAPLEISQYQPPYQLGTASPGVQLGGLLLQHEHTGANGGVFRRLGHFCVFDYKDLLAMNEKNDMNQTSAPDHVQDCPSRKSPSGLQGTSPLETDNVSQTGDSEAFQEGVSVSTKSAADHDLEMSDKETSHALNAQQNQQGPHLSNAGSLVGRWKQKVVQWQQVHSASQTSEDLGGMFDEDDPYGNGPINPQLLGRYDGAIGREEYPEICAFLSLLEHQRSLNPAWVKESGVESHGDGCYTYGII